MKKSVPKMLLISFPLKSGMSWRRCASFPRNAAGQCLCDYGDAPSAESIKFRSFNRDLSSLLLRTRSVIVIDWRAITNHSVIRNYLTGWGGPAVHHGSVNNVSGRRNAHGFRNEL